jgi:hypothetical protein
MSLLFVRRPAKLPLRACPFILPLRFRPRGHQIVEQSGERSFTASAVARKRGWRAFTVSEFDPAKLLTSAVVDQARKHRKRPPDEVRQIDEHRKTRSRDGA